MGNSSAWIVAVGAVLLVGLVALLVTGEGGTYVSPDAIVEDFRQDSQTAPAKYRGKRLEFSAVAFSAAVEADLAAVLLEDKGALITCWMRRGKERTAETVEKNRRLTMAGALTEVDGRKLTFADCTIR